MESDYKTGKVCVFCFKADNEYFEQVGLNRFLKFLERFTNFSREKAEAAASSDISEICSKLIRCCKVCGLIVQAFCEDYHKIKCLEMKMEWKLHRLLGVMDYAGRVPSRLQKIRKTFQNCKVSSNHITGDHHLECLKMHREQIIKRCKTRLSKSQPHVLLERSEEATELAETFGMTNFNSELTIFDPNKIKKEIRITDDIIENVMNGHPQLDDMEAVQNFGAQDKLEPKDDIGSDSEAFPENCSDSQDNWEGSNKSDEDLGNAEADGEGYQCEKCSKMYPTQSKLSSHVSSVHATHHCKECDLPFKTWFLLKKHALHKHPKASSSSQWKCPECGHKFVKKSYLTEHLAYTHKKGTKSIPCEKCNKLFFTKRQLQKHISTVHIPATHQCSVCEKCFKTGMELKRHQFIHTDPSTWEFKCEVCSKPFYTKPILKVHVKRRHASEKNKKYQCTECGKMWATKTYLEKHMFTHKKGEMVAVCQICGKSYPHSLALEQHLRRQHGEKQQEARR